MFNRVKLHFFARYADKMIKFMLILVSLLILNCKKADKSERFNVSNPFLEYSKNILNYHITPKDSIDKSGLMFSDQGAWFAYGLPKDSNTVLGFSGPFLMTQQNGVWISKMLTSASIVVDGNLQQFKNNTDCSYSSHLEKLSLTDKVEVFEKLVFCNGNTALLQTKIKNIGKKSINIDILWENLPIYISGVSLSKKDNFIQIDSKKSTVKGYVTFPKGTQIELLDTLKYNAKTTIDLKPNQVEEITIANTFIFPKYSWKNESTIINNLIFDSIFDKRKKEKNSHLELLLKNKSSQFNSDKYSYVLAKSYLTLQNNWRVSAGELTNEGLFPSYHYKWFNGFWSWDSWKHAVGLSYYDTSLAKNQVRVMFDFQTEDGFIADCIFRDTTIEAHNYRDTKPPLSAWAVTKIYEKDNDIEFVEELYPKLKKYHQWWYNKRDYDKDGLCEYGSTDGTLIAAKWESGMDNAIRFDNSKILKNDEHSYSLNQESVDLNAYLYAEKLYLSKLAKLQNNLDDSNEYANQAKVLKEKIQNQFYDKSAKWFYDTNLKGDEFIRGEGSEGWIALWANAATDEQAKAVKDKMMNPKKFYTKVPFQTMSADHEKFDPLNGYWRGPNWLDQAYFAVKGLRNYGFEVAANQATYQIIEGAEGILEKGKPIHENYHPISGKGLNAKNFSWSAAHLIMLLQKD